MAKNGQTLFRGLHRGSKHLPVKGSVWSLQLKASTFKGRLDVIAQRSISLVNSQADQKFL